MFRHRFKALREKYPFFEPIILGAVVVLWFLVSGFIEVADDVMEGDTHAIDTQILMMMRDGNDPQNAWGPPWVQEMMRDISGLGGIAILTMVTFSAALYLIMMKKYGQGLYLVVSVSLGTALTNLLKSGFDRPRPDLVPHGSYVFTGSFPSGHSMMSAWVFLSVGALLARAHKSYSMKIYFLTTSIFLTVAIGISRVYLGVHWPSDVLAGWLVGGAAAISFWLLEWAWVERIWTKVRFSPKPE
jgi:undecaprenyl-diphosphatase